MGKRKYYVYVTRTAYRHGVVMVEASSLKEAEAKAIDIAGMLNYGGEYAANYSVDSVEEVSE